jgi:hypothetical protein
MNLCHLLSLLRGWLPAFEMHLRSFTLTEWLLLAGFVLFSSRTIRTCGGSR